MRAATWFWYCLLLSSLCAFGQNASTSNAHLERESGEHGQAVANIISVNNGEVSLSNPLGCRLVIYHDGKGYGLGTFSFHDAKMGGTLTTFLREDNNYVWDEYKANRYEIVENTPERGTIKFYGVVGGGERNMSSKWNASITLTSRNTAYEIHYQVEPYLWSARFHPLYVSVPFTNAEMQFVQYPLETPLRPPFTGHWEVYPDVGKVPFIFGKETIQGAGYFVGVGYSLTGQDYTRGRLQYDAVQANDPLKIYFPYHWYPASIDWGSAALAHEPPEESPKFRTPGYELRMIVSTAEDQAACIRGYREASGFDVSTPIRRSIDDSMKALMRAYKDAPLNTFYIPGKGYRGRGWANSDDRGNYYVYIWPGSNVQLAYQLYEYWTQHPTETWAKERAIEMANFFIKSQLPNGAVARNWDEEKQEYTAEAPNLPPAGFIYCPWNTSLGAENLYKLYLERKRVENIDETKWKDSALLGMNWIVSRINAEGLLAHSYDKNDKSSGMIGSAPSYALRALDSIYQETQDEKYDRARAKLEAWYYKNFAAVNDYYNDLDDTYTWRPPASSPQFRDNDALLTFDFAAYCAKRYMETREPRYLQWAKDVTAYGWLTRMPVQMPGFTHGTRGIIEEQTIWPMYDVPWASGSDRVFAYLALLTGDPFYAEYYKLLIQTQISFQQYDEKYPFFASVLSRTPDMEKVPLGEAEASSSRRPYDRLQETIDGKIGVWLIWYTAFFLEDMKAPYMYSYFGGKDWGVGMDYALDFKPDFGDNPYIMAASTRLTSAGWNEQDHSLYAHLNGEAGSKGTLRLKWDPVKYPPAQVVVEIDGKAISPGAWKYDPADQSLTVKYEHRESTVEIEVRSK